MKKIRVILISTLILIILLMIFSVIFSIFNMNNKKIINGITIGQIEIGNLDKEQAIKKITENINTEITIYHKQFEENISIEELNIEAKIEQAVDVAFKIGKSGNIVKDNYQILDTLLFGKQINIDIEIDGKKVNQKIQEIDGKLPNGYVDNSYYIEENNLIIKKGTDGIKIQKEEFIRSLKQSFTSTNKQIQIPVENKKIDDIDIQKIYNEIYREPRDAYVVQTPKVEVYPEVNGIDFSITLAQAKDLLKEEKEEYIIPLKITSPEKTIDKLGKEAFPEKLSEYVTRYDASNKNRSNNLELASKKIDGTIVMPGEIFSYNKTVGERTISAGYKEAAIYSGGKVIDGIGGGICQLSSTLYNAVVYANLEIVSRSNHQFLTSYVPAGRDATVSWGTIDFKFKNTRNYPIKIVSNVKNGLATVKIYGMKEDEEYEIVIESKVTQAIPYTVNYIEDSNLEKGKEEIQQYGSNGAKSITYKIFKKNGVEISKSILSNDTYNALERIVIKGTKIETPTSITEMVNEIH